MAIIGVFTVEQVKLYARQHQEMWWIALVIMIVSLISLACCPGVRRKTPHNFVFLGLFTVAEGFLLGAVTSTYDANEVLMAVGVCAAITLALTVFAFQTKVDFTAMGGVLIAVLMVFFLFGLIAIFLPQSRTLRLVYASIGAIIFSLYIIYDTQLMVGGSHKNCKCFKRRKDDEEEDLILSTEFQTFLNGLSSDEDVSDVESEAQFGDELVDLDDDLLEF